MLGTTPDPPRGSSFAGIREARQEAPQFTEHRLRLDSRLAHLIYVRRRLKSTTFHEIVTNALERYFGAPEGSMKVYREVSASRGKAPKREKPLRRERL